MCGLASHGENLTRMSENKRDHFVTTILKSSVLETIPIQSTNSKLLRNSVLLKCFRFLVEIVVAVSLNFLTMVKTL